MKKAVEKLIESGKLGLKPESCKVFHNKRYFSKDRNREIVVDVSIELIPPRTSQPSLIWIWECKNYSGAVRVDDVEEFHAKLEQIGADKTKGTIITTGYYQESAIQYALSKGIGLVRLVKGKNVHIEFEPPLGSYYIDYDAVREHTTWVCCSILKHTGKLEFFWNSYFYPLPPSSDRYFFSLTFKNKGAYGACLETLLIYEMLEICEKETSPISQKDLLNLIDSIMSQIRGETEGRWLTEWLSKRRRFLSNFPDIWMIIYKEKRHARE